MEKVKYVFIFVLFSVVAVLTYSLLKSWFFFDKGIEVGEEEIPTQEVLPEVIPKDGISENSKIIWKNFLFYPTEPSIEEGGIGPTGIVNHARNLTFVNLSNGKVKKLFDKKVYIWDYFPGEFVRKLNLSYQSQDSQKEKDSLEITQKFIILAITKDTNGDGFLNNKDKMKVFLYDPSSETLVDILPEELFFEKLFYNTKKDTLVMLVKALASKTEPNPISQIFIYDSVNSKSTLVDLEVKKQKQ